MQKRIYSTTQHNEAHEPAREAMRKAGKSVNFGIGRTQTAKPNRARERKLALHFVFQFGNIRSTLDGRVATCIHVAQDGFAVFRSGDDVWLVNPDGRAFDRKDTLVGFKPSSGAHMRVWYPGRVSR